MSADDGVSAADRRKAAFLAEYRQLCEEHGMMVVMREVVTEEDNRIYVASMPDAEIDANRYLVFSVFSIEGVEIMLDSAIEEMRIEPMFEPMDEET